MTRLLPLLLLAACGSSAQLEVDPARVDWGEVDFQQEIPETGLSPQTLSIRNVGKDDLTVTIEDVDPDRFVLGAFLQSEDPPTLPALTPGATMNITIGVSGYDIAAGERDTEVTGEFVLGGPSLKEPVVVPWAYVPVRSFDTDTGG